MPREREHGDCPPNSLSNTSPDFGEHVEVLPGVAGKSTLLSPSAENRTREKPCSPEPLLVCVQKKGQDPWPQEGTKSLKQPSRNQREEKDPSPQKGTKVTRIKTRRRDAENAKNRREQPAESSQNSGILDDSGTKRHKKVQRKAGDLMKRSFKKTD